MTLGKASLLTAGLVGMFALGVESGPAIHDSWSKTRTPEAPVSTPAAHVETSTPAAPAPVRTARPAHRPSAAPPTTESISAKKPDGAIQMIAVSLWEPQLRNRVKSVLNPGSQLDLAAADFNSSEQFLTVAHAARNTSVPFMVLKDRVVNQGQSLTDALRELKPHVDAKAEAARARSEARSDLGTAG